MITRSALHCNPTRFDRAEEGTYAEDDDEGDQNPDTVIRVVVVKIWEQLVHEGRHLHFDRADSRLKHLHVGVVVAKLRRQEALKDIVQRRQPKEENQLIRDLAYGLNEARKKVENLHQAGAHGHGRRRGGEDRHEELPIEGHQDDPQEDENEVLKEVPRLLLEADREVVHHREDQRRGEEIRHLDDAYGHRVGVHAVHVRGAFPVENRAEFVEGVYRRDVAHDPDEQRGHEDQRSATVGGRELAVVLLEVHRPEQQRDEGGDDQPGQVVLGASIVAHGRSPHAHPDLGSDAGGVEAVKLHFGQRPWLRQAFALELLVQHEPARILIPDVVEVAQGRRSCPGANDVEHVDRWVRPRLVRYRSGNRGKVLDDRLAVVPELAEVHRAAAALEKEQLVELIEDGLRGLVDRRDDGASAVGGLLDGLHHESSRTGVQATGGLVQEENGRVGGQLDTNRQPLGLLLGQGGDLQIADVLQVQGVHDALHVAIHVDVGDVLLEAQARAELQAFEDRQRLHVNVHLLAVADDSGEGLPVKLVAVDEDAARDVTTGLSARNHIHESRLAGPGRSHERRARPVEGVATDLVEQLELIVLADVHRVGQIPPGKIRGHERETPL
eukprot:scaffold4562_cov255-Pinguiococcus_pyrenoidosus.AAC.5